MIKKNGGFCAFHSKGEWKHSKLYINYKEVMCFLSIVWCCCPKNAECFDLPNNNGTECSFSHSVSEKIDGLQWLSGIIIISRLVLYFGIDFSCSLLNAINPNSPLIQIHLDIFRTRVPIVVARIYFCMWIRKLIS